MVFPSRRSNSNLDRRKQKTPFRIGLIQIFLFLGLLSLLLFLWMHHVLTQTTEASSSRNNAANHLRPMSPHNPSNNNVQVKIPPSILRSPRSTYKDWRELAVSMAALPPDQILDILKTQDPFGVRRFEQTLLQAESDQQAILSMDDMKKLFPCPTNERISLPDQRNHQLAKYYRQGIQKTSNDGDVPFVFLFFQHLRKAGGTNFCGLAQHNLLKPQVPSYFCMPDMKWSGRKCAGCFLSFTNQEIESHMVEDGHRILGNEWDPFDERFFDLPAVFATSFRRPLDRALSQFRFECIEDRGCKFKEVEPWWKKRMDLTNVYTWTFSKEGLRKISVGEKQSDAAKRQEVLGKALDTVAKYNLVLVMEWLAYAPDHVRDVLGFQDTTTMTERIRPHLSQAVRDDGQDKNKLGAAGIAKASWTPETYLSKEQYKIMSENLALDEILTDAARRLFLERAVCSDMTESNWV
eukprot:Nitzschia sp. Nitz4//scaffold44_size153857//58577//60030//NITZ4_002716-RA/size153857-augustus-gene-0.20-mRNA-1//-1//CDS//3329552142//7580//frame0